MVRLENGPEEENAICFTLGRYGGLAGSIES